MKKRILMCMIASAMVCGSLVSCGKTEDSDVAPKVSSTTTAPAGETQPEATTSTTTAAGENTEAEPATTATPTDAEPTTAENTAAPANVSSDSLGHLTDAVSILNNLNTIDMIGGGSGIQVDSSTTQTVGSMVYAKVTDYRFSCLDDVKNYINDNICGTLIQRYIGIYDGEGADFKEFNGELYYIQTALGSGFSFDSDPVITDVTDTSFTITVTFADYGADSTMVIKAVNDGGKWKASSFKINNQIENTH
ncbi:MAG: hypothetical protein K6G33_10475 [Ruminococcus sp.]|uniref:hypothetical protein n=1 Tax=Ruminococcus sp. TaxID=41978 RepID=UPI0025D20355|nr:hypothetical protein [Ruminococcus sp.]MCR5601149.1 hypothetical protein [Ruminococcus sp.]